MIDFFRVVGKGCFVFFVCFTLGLTSLVFADDASSEHIPPVKENQFDAKSAVEATHACQNRYAKEIKKVYADDRNLDTTSPAVTPNPAGGALVDLGAANHTKLNARGTRLVNAARSRVRMCLAPVMQWTFLYDKSTDDASETMDFTQMYEIQLPNGGYEPINWISNREVETKAEKVCANLKNDQNVNLVPLVEYYCWKMLETWWVNFPLSVYYSMDSKQQLAQIKRVMAAGRHAVERFDQYCKDRVGISQQERSDCYVQAGELAFSHGGEYMDGQAAFELAIKGFQHAADVMPEDGNIGVLAWQIFNVEEGRLEKLKQEGKTGDYTMLIYNTFEHYRAIGNNAHDFNFLTEAGKQLYQIIRNVTYGSVSTKKKYAGLLKIYEASARQALLVDIAKVQNRMHATSDSQVTAELLKRAHTVDELAAILVYVSKHPDAMRTDLKPDQRPHPSREDGTRADNPASDLTYRQLTDWVQNRKWQTK